MSTFPFETVKIIGINLDIVDSELPPTVYSGLQNFRYSTHRMSRVNGDTVDSILNPTPVAAEPTFVIGVRSATVFFWVIVGTTEIHVFNGTTWDDITPGGGLTHLATDKWSGGVINGVLYISSPSQDPIFWDGIVTNPMTTITGWPASTKAKCVRTFNNHLVAYSLTESSVPFPNRVRWSNSAEAGNIPDSWDETDATKDTGLITLAGTEGEIVDSRQLYENNIIYKNNSAYIMSFVGGQELFSFRELFHDIGVINRNCIARFRGRQAVFTQDDFIIHDGRTAESIVNNKIKNHVFNNINYDASDACYVFEYHLVNEIWFCYPTGSSASSTEAVIWNYKDDQLGIRDLSEVDFINTGLITQSSIGRSWNDQTAQDWDTDIRTWNSNQITDTHLLPLGIYKSFTEIANGTFTDTSAWGIDNGGWTIVTGSPGHADCDGTQTGASNLFQFIPLVLDDYYDITYTVTNYAAGTVAATIGADVGIGRSANGTYIEQFQITNASDAFAIGADISFVGDVSNVVVKKTTRLCHIDLGSNFADKTVAAKIEKLTIPIANYFEVKLIRCFIPHIIGVPGQKVYIRVGVQLDITDPVSWGEEKLFTIGTDKKHFVILKGRFLSFSIRSDDGSSFSVHEIGYEAKVFERY